MFDWPQEDARACACCFPGACSRACAAGRQCSDSISNPQITACYDRFARYVLASGNRRLDTGKVLVTDRMHPHILAALRSQPVVLLPDRFGKNRAVYEYTSRNYSTVHWADTPAEALSRAPSPGALHIRDSSASARPAESGDMEGVGKRLTVGAMWTAGGRIISNLLGMVSTLTLARLLTPDDFGLVALATIVFSIIQAVTELSLSSALIQHKDPQREHYDTAFTLSIFRSLAIALAAGHRRLSRRRRLSGRPADRHLLHAGREGAGQRPHQSQARRLSPRGSPFTRRSSPT